MPPGLRGRKKCGLTLSWWRDALYKHRDKVAVT
jgi:hypothetical protein